MFDDGVGSYSHQFNLSHNSSGPVVISSPTDKQLFDLNQQNYIATSPVPFIATTTGSGPINWNAALSYNTSQGYGYFSHNRSFSTASGQEHDETYQSEGGRVCVNAQTTLSDGSSAQDSVTFYIDGVDGSKITPSLINGQLDSLYPQSYSYKNSLSDGTATMNLMTGIAKLESQYRQFTSVLDPASIRDPDLYNLYAQFGIVAYWPEESHQDGGSHIGLMMVPTTNSGWEWNWQNNTAEGVTIFSGGSPTMDDKVQDAVRFEGYIVNGNKSLGLPAHIGLASPLNAMQRENNALVLYRGVGLGPTTADTLNELYYIAVCPLPGTWTSTNKGLKCTVGNWQWLVNTTGQPTGVSYANTVRQNLQ